MSSYLTDLEKGDIMNLSETSSFKFAISIENYLGRKQMKNSPEFVKWIVRLYTEKNGVASAQELNVHKCTDADYDQFYPI